jgi:hypothetical protein
MRYSADVAGEIRSGEKSDISGIGPRNKLIPGRHWSFLELPFFTRSSSGIHTILVRGNQECIATIWCLFKQDKRAEEEMNDGE